MPPSTRDFSSSSSSSFSSFSSSPPNSDTSIYQTSSPSVTVEFAEIDAHTAKCDLCNTRNASGMSRCDACGWQACYACLRANDGDRTHTGNGRVHTGFLDVDFLEDTSRVRRGRVVKDDDDDDDDEEDRTDSEAETSTSKEDNSCSTKKDSGYYSDVSDGVLEAARNLLAFSMEAKAMVKLEAYHDGDRYRHITRQQVHEHALLKADLALREYLETGAEKERLDAAAKEEGYAGESETEIDEDVLSSKAQMFARKTAGRRSS